MYIDRWKIKGPGQVKSDEFIREVNEELQQEKLAGLWKQYGAIIIGIAVAIVAGTAGIVGWQSYSANQLQAQGETRALAEQALLEGRHDEAIQSFTALGQDFGGGPAAIAAFGEAAALQAAGNAEKAADRLAALKTQDGIDPTFADLATLQSIQLRVDSGDPTAMMAELEPLAASGSAWSLSARETLAIVAIRAGETERAKTELISVIEDAFTPAAMQSRATELLLAIGGELPSDGEEGAAE